MKGRGFSRAASVAKSTGLQPPERRFSIETGHLGVRIEQEFLVGQDGKLIDLIANLPHTADEVEAAMKAR